MRTIPINTKKGSKQVSTEKLKEKVDTFETLEPGLALRADLVALSALILIASLADREGTLVAGDEELAVDGEPNIIPANLADLAAELLQWPRLQQNRSHKKKRRNKRSNF